MKKITVCILGDSNTGKTSYLNYLSNTNFSLNHDSTAGVDLKTINFNKDNIFWKVYDTSGNPNFRTITRQYLKLKDVYLLFFDLNDEISFKSVSYWMELIKDYSEIILVGNKSDLERKVSNNQIFFVTSKYNIKYIEVSIKNNLNLNNIPKMINNLNFNKKLLSYDSNGYIEFNDDQVRKCFDCKCVIL